MVEKGLALQTRRLGGEALAGAIVVWCLQTVEHRQQEHQHRLHGEQLAAHQQALLHHAQTHQAEIAARIIKSLQH